MADTTIRALGSVINNYKIINGFGHSTYPKSFHSTFGTILDYVSEVWGYKTFLQMNEVQNKSIKILTYWGGIHKFVSFVIMNGDMSLTASCKYNYFWNKLMFMNNSHFPQIIFNWNYSCPGNT